MEPTTGPPARAHPVSAGPAGTDASPALEQLIRSGPALFATSFLGYSLMALVSVQFIDMLAVAPVLWPAAGLSVALLLLVPAARWPIVLSGVALAELSVDTVSGFSVGPTVLWSVGNVVGPLTAAMIIRRLARHPTHLVPASELVVFLGGAVVVGPVVGGTIGAVGTSLSGSGFAEAWPSYVLNDALGVLVVAPLLLSRRIRPVRDNLVEVGCLTAAFLATTALIFAGSPGGWTASLPYLVIPILVWGGLRFGTRGAAALSAVFAPTALVLTAAGFGPFDALARALADRHRAAAVPHGDRLLGAAVGLAGRGSAAARHLRGDPAPRGHPRPAHRPAQQGRPRGDPARPPRPPRA